MVFCTEFGWVVVLRAAAWVVCTVRMVPCDSRHHPHRTHDLRSGSQDHHPSKNSVQETICCNLTSNAPDDGRMYTKHVELRILRTSIKSIEWPYCVKFSFHIILLGRCSVKQPSGFAVLHWEMSLINGCIPVQYCPHRVHIGVLAFWCLSRHFIDLQHVAAVMSCFVCYANTKLPPINWCIAWKFNELWGTFNGSVKAWAMCTVSSALLIRQ